jgi:predicted RND superfamily exporter protein
MGRALTGYTRWVVQRPVRVLCGVFAVTVVLACGSAFLRIEVSPDAQLPQGHPYIQTLNDVHRLFGDKNLVVVGLLPHDGRVFTPAFLAKLNEVTTRLMSLPGANLGLAQSLAASQAKVIHSTPEGMEVERVMDSPPTDQEGADAVRRRAFGNEAYVGTLVSQDASAALVQASFELTPSTPGYRHLYQAVLGELQAAADGTFKYELSGPVVFLSQLSVYAAKIAYYFPLALLVIGAVHYHAFRTLQALFLPLLTALFSVLWALGVMGFVGVPLDPYNTTTPILILAVAAGHAVQVLKRFYEEYERLGDVEDAVVSSLSRVGPVMLAAATVAALAFCSLLTFRTASIRTFGLFTALGILAAVIVELSLIPAVRVLLPAPQLREKQREAAAHPWIDAFLRGCVALATRRRLGIVLASTGIFAIVCGLGAARVRVDTSLKHQFGPREPVRVEDADLNARFAGTNTLILLVEGAGEGSMEEPTVMRAVYQLERRLETEGGVGKALSYVDFVRQMHIAMNGDRPDAGVLPATRALTVQYLFLYSLSGGAGDIDSYLDPMHRAAKIRLLVHEDSTRYGEQIIALASELVSKTFPPGYRVRYTGTVASTAAVTEVMVKGKLWNIAQIITIAFVVSALCLRSWVGGSLVVVPLLMSVLVNFGVMGLLDIPLDTGTAVVSAMAVGIGADYAIYLLFRAREELASGGTLDEALTRTVLSSGKAIIFVSSAIALGYATLCLSGFAFHEQLGGLVALAMVVSSLTAVVLLPAILVGTRPKFLSSIEVPAEVERQADGSIPARVRESDWPAPIPPA